MLIHRELLRAIPHFPNYTMETFGYPERLLKTYYDYIFIFGPPIHKYYEESPDKNCEVHVSGIPGWATMADIVKIFERFGKIYTVELPAYRDRADTATSDGSSSGSTTSSPASSYGPPAPQILLFGAGEVMKKELRDSLVCKDWAKVTFMSYDGAQRALDSHMRRRIPGSTNALSIYKGTVSNVVIVKNLPAKEEKSKITERLNEYPGLMKIEFLQETAARLIFMDLDLALLFMDAVTADELVISGFTCTCEPDEPAEEAGEVEEGDDEAISETEPVVEVSEPMNLNLK